MEKLARLPPAFDRISDRGTLTAGNSSPITDGATSVWVATKADLSRLPDDTPFARLVDFEIASVDLRNEGLLMAPSCAIPRLFQRHNLRYEPPKQRRARAKDVLPEQGASLAMDAHGASPDRVGTYADDRTASGAHGEKLLDALTEIAGPRRGKGMADGDGAAIRIDA